MTIAVSTEKTATSTISSRPSRQFIARVSGSSTSAAMKVDKLVAEEAEPHAEQAVRARQHHLHQPAGMRVAVEGQRQGQHVPEEPPHGQQPVAVRHALGEQRRRRYWRRCPTARPRPRAPAAPAASLQTALVRHVDGAGQHVDHPAEQHGLEEQQPGHGDVRHGHAERHPAIPLQQTEDPSIQPE